jgi:hypothetical protein
MIDFTVHFAGQAVAASVLYPKTRDYCTGYLCDEAPAFSVAITPEDIAFEREKSKREDQMEGIPAREFTDTYLETIALQRKITEGLFDHDVLLFHGSVVAVDGVAYLFTAKSGTGKSTHTRFWRETFGDRAVMVNDDKPFLQITSSGVLACGSPWSGKHGLDANITVPLQGICILERGKENQIHRISPEEALPMLLHQSYCPLAAEKKQHFESLVQLLTEKTSLWQMYCNMDPTAAEISHKAMSE